MPRCLPRPVVPLRRSPRRGLTLLELLIVLVILGISAGVVVVSAGRPATGGTDVLTRARRRVVSRSEALRLTVDGDGAWTLTAPDGRVVEAGTDGGAKLDVLLDPLGSCLPVTASAAGTGAAPFDPLSCRTTRVGS